MPPSFKDKKLDEYCQIKGSSDYDSSDYDDNFNNEQFNSDSTGDFEGYSEFDDFESNENDVQSDNDFNSGPGFEIKGDTDKP